MRLRRRLMLALYLLCAAAVVGGLGWITWRTVRLEHDSRAEAMVRLALWRMDSALTPVIAQEAARPYFHYLPFYPFERAYTQLWQEVRPGEVVAPSPLLNPESPLVKLHFQIEPDGRLTSPQAPSGNMRDQAEAEYVSPQRIIEAEQRLVEMALLLRPERRAGRGETAERARAARKLAPGAPEPGAGAEEARDGAPSAPPSFGRRLGSLDALDPSLPAALRPPPPGDEGRSRPSPQRAEALDFSARQEQADVARGVVQNFSKAPALADSAFDVHRMDRTQINHDAERIEQGPLRAHWLADGELALLRTVRLQQGEITQGVWLDWPALRTWLEAQIHDLLPEGRLVAAPTRGTGGAGGAGGAGDGHMLATIPAALIAGAPAASIVTTPARLALIVTWIAVLAAVTAGGLILRASMKLAERRGRFVSAVTHELRTPLTTFRLYSDMLAEGAITEESRRREYLATLQAESQRLGTIVENVLEYARLGSGPLRRTASDHAPEPLGPALSAIEPDLRARAVRCGLELQITGDAGAAQVRAPASAIERIIANLVDNACKYAADAEDRRLILHTRVGETEVEIALRDFGPGVPAGEAGRIFDAWTRARRDAHSGTSGLGLGLSISRALARQLGGDLELRQAEGGKSGAEFVLRLPLV